MTVYETVGEKIRALRVARGMSQDALASEVKTTANTISRWETAVYRPSISDIANLAQFFGVGIAAFFEGSSKGNSPLAVALIAATLLAPKYVGGTTPTGPDIDAAMVLARHMIAVAQARFADPE